MYLVMEDLTGMLTLFCPLYHGLNVLPARLEFLALDQQHQSATRPKRYNYA